MLGGNKQENYFIPGPNGESPVMSLVSKKDVLPVYDIPCVVGRDRQNVDLYVFDYTVSRRHLVIGTYGDRLTVTDEGSTVGTVINKEKLEKGIPYYLSDGDTVFIGELEFTCHINKFKLKSLTE